LLIFVLLVDVFVYIQSWSYDFGSGKFFSSSSASCCIARKQTS